MAVDSRKRQKKLEKQKAKKKAERTTIARRQSLGISARLEAAVRRRSFTAAIWRPFGNRASAVC